MGAIQAGLVIGVRHAKDKNIEWPAILMAVASALLLAAGVGRHYIDVYVHRTVRGISFIFVGIDALGDIFSLVSVIFQPTLDILGMVIYATELVLWIGIFMCGAYYNLVPWLKGKRPAEGSEPTLPDDLAAVSAETEDRGHAVLASGIALHELPSSTSVFRTPSAEFEMMRRGVNEGASGEGIQSRS